MELPLCARRSGHVCAHSSQFFYLVLSFVKPPLGPLARSLALRCYFLACVRHGRPRDFTGGHKTDDSRGDSGGPLQQTFNRELLALIPARALRYYPLLLSCSSCPSALMSSLPPFYVALTIPQACCPCPSLPFPCSLLLQARPTPFQPSLRDQPYHSLPRRPGTGSYPLCLRP